MKLRAEILNQHIDSLQKANQDRSVDQSGLDQSRVYELQDRITDLNKDLDTVIKENENLKLKIRDLEQ